ncbi:hypothetical protein ACFCYN_25205, partial [Gottfriedia sp. NPDC056225]|uniref:hypothetical protein n=1 Tax=Gottfriedia sp. NPDC056225 TaxID=3345751 RepID=UPI0035DC815C
INFYTDKYLSLPFTKRDLLGVALAILQIPFLILIFKIFSRSSSIGKKVRVFLSLLSGLTSFIIIGIILGQVLPGL